VDEVFGPLAAALLRLLALVVVLGGLGFQVGEFCEGERDGQRGGVALGEFELVHVDAVGQAEKTAGDAGAVDGGVDGPEGALLAGLTQGPADCALGGIDKALHFVGDSEATVDDLLVALIGEPALGAEALDMVEAALFTVLGVGLPALVALEDSGDGGLVESQGVGDPALGFAVELDPFEDQVVVVGGLPGAGRAGGGSGDGHGRAPIGFQIWDLGFGVRGRGETP
jgi:hypothetical protein